MTNHLLCKSTVIEATAAVGKSLQRAAFLALYLVLAAFLSMSGLLRAEEQLEENAAKPMVGIASYYGAKFNGRLTASGEIYDENEMTAAHRSLPFGTQLKVTHLKNGRSVIVRVNDRGPYARGRIIDVSKAAAKEIGLVRKGVARVKLLVLE